jgi:DNA-directed RNA polymerase specialized sigma24 family protein
LEHNNGSGLYRWRGRASFSDYDWNNRSIYTHVDRGILDILGKRHDEWVKMAMSLGCNSEEANELTQQMYLRLHKYVDNPERIMYNEEKVNTYYVYVTLRNLFLSRSHAYNLKNHVELTSGRLSQLDVDILNIEKEEAFTNLIDRIKRIVHSWYWYDKKLWDIHFYNKMSMRAISKETTISLSSIFNTLKNGKKKVKQQAEEQYKDYLDTKEES